MRLKIVRQLSLADDLYFEKKMEEQNIWINDLKILVYWLKKYFWTV